MTIIGWVIVGLLAGGLGRMIVGEEKRGCLATIAVGLVGAFIGGGLYRFWKDEPFQFDDVDFGSIGVSVLGAVVFLLLLRAVGSGRSRQRT